MSEGGREGREDREGGRIESRREVWSRREGMGGSREGGA